MATPCKKCGAEKTENVHHGLLYAAAKALGYRLRMCSRCHRLRLVPRNAPKNDSARSGSTEVRKELAFGACPKCGKVDFRRSHRTLLERLTFRGPMVRCRACRTRYSRPKPVLSPR